MLKVQNFYFNKSLSFFNAKKVLRFAGVGTLLIVGYFQYVDSYHFPKWKVFLSGVIMGAPFSLGIFLSTLKLGKRFRISTSVLIIFSALLRSLLLIPPSVSIFIFLFELYAVWTLFDKRTI